MLIFLNYALYALPILTLCMLPIGGLRSIVTLKLTAFGAACAVITAVFSSVTSYMGHLSYFLAAMFFAVYYMRVSHLRPMNALFWFFSALHFISFCISVSNAIECQLTGRSKPFLTLEFTVVFLSLQVILLPLVVHLLKTYFLPIFNHAEKTQPSWLLFCLPLTQLAICALLGEIYVVHDLPLSVRFLLINIISYFGTLVSYLLCARLIRESANAARLSERLETADLLMQTQRSQYLEQARSYERMRTIRHDLKYQFSVLRACLDEGDFDRMRSYLDIWQQEVESTAPAQYSDHLAVNTLVQAMLSSASVTGVRAQIRLPLANCGVEDTDLCVLVGNCLQNALDGCATAPEAERFVEMSAGCQNGQLTLLVRNSFDGITYASEDGMLSRKRGYAKNGIGLASIRAIVERYMGVMKIDHTGKVFTLMLYLQPGAVAKDQADAPTP